MEWKENFGMEYGRCSEWNGMEDRPPYLRNSELHILKLITNHKLNVCVYQYVKSDNKTIFANYCIWPEIIAT